MKVEILYNFTKKTIEDEIDKVGTDNITELCIFSNKNIIEIPHLPNLKKLWCTFCTNIISIPLMETLEEIVCVHCPNILKIDHFPNLKKLWYTNNNGFSIPKIKKMEELWCYQCPNILEIPYFPNLEYLICDKDLKIRFYNKDLGINNSIYSIQHFQGRLFQNTYRTYELLIF